MFKKNNTINANNLYDINSNVKNNDSNTNFDSYHIHLYFDKIESNELFNIYQENECKSSTDSSGNDNPI